MAPLSFLLLPGVIRSAELVDWAVDDSVGSSRIVSRTILSRLVIDSKAHGREDAEALQVWL